MKTALLILLSSLGMVQAQNFSVLLYGTNAPVGFPTNWPKGIQAIGTNTTVTPPFLLMNQAALDNLIATNRAAYNAYQSNQLFAITSNSASNYSAWSNMYVQMPQGITDSSNRFNTFTNMSAVMNSLRSSWQSGTNNASGTNVIISRLLTNMVLWAQQDQVGWTYLNQVIVYLSRLGPGLQQVYQPANDPVGH